MSREDDIEAVRVLLADLEFNDDISEEEYAAKHAELTAKLHNLLDNP